MQNCPPDIFRGATCQKTIHLAMGAPSIAWGTQDATDRHVQMRGIGPMKDNRQIMFVKRPQGMVSLDCFSLQKTSVPKPKDHQILLRTLYLSVDPYMRGRMNDRKSYAPPFELHQVMAGRGVAKVVESRDSRWAVGDVVFGQIPWQDYSLSEGTGLRKLDPSVAPITTALHLLGLAGLTAYFGLTTVAPIRPGDTVVVSGAAGSVGIAALQIARLLGGRTVGIAGGPHKAEFLYGQLAVDAAVDYKAGGLSEALEAVCPSGVDVYFDNVGGDVTDAVLSYLNRGARVAICGQISQYNLDHPDVGPRGQFTALLTQRATATGFIVGDFQEGFGAALEKLTAWYQKGQLVMPENVVEGLENAPLALIDLFYGANVGKQLVKVSDADH